MLLYQVQPHKNQSHLHRAKLQQSSGRGCFTDNEIVQEEEGEKRSLRSLV